jgi:hypothetical protein
MNLDRQRLIKIDSKKYDKLEFVITCWSDWHFEQLKKEWEENFEREVRPFGAHSGFDVEAYDKNSGFDVEAHEKKRMASQIRYEREFWFDISDVYNRAGSSPPIPTVS